MDSDNNDDQDRSSQVVVLSAFAQYVEINTAYKASISSGPLRGKVVKVNKARGLQ